jgi:hypothetical protein
MIECLSKGASGKWNCIESMEGCQVGLRVGLGDLCGKLVQSLAILFNKAAILRMAVDMG